MLGEPHCLCVPLLQKVGGRTQSGMAAAGSGQPVFLGGYFYYTQLIRLQQGCLCAVARAAPPEGV
jgi:hypothetical protein